MVDLGTDDCNLPRLQNEPKSSPLQMLYSWYEVFVLKCCCWFSINMVLCIMAKYHNNSSSTSCYYLSLYLLILLLLMEAGKVGFIFPHMLSNFKS